MSQVGQPTERRNGKGTRGGITPDAAGPIESDSDSDEEQQNQVTQLPDGREPRRWITKREWNRYIQEDHLRNRPSCVVSIFRVPNLLKDVKKEAYVLLRDSLGPLHHRSPELPPMEDHKGRALRRIMKRFNAYNKKLPVDPNDMDFANRAMKEILKLENRIRDSNGKTLNSVVNVEKVLLDVVLKVKSVLFDSFYENIDIEQWSWPRPVEEEVHHLLGFLHTVIASPPSSTHDEPVDQGERNISIGCCISECIRMLQGKREAQNDAKSIPHATELRNGGIKFLPLQTGGINKISFEEKRATIFLPRISIMDETEIVFRNLIAFEVCKPSQINYVTCYVRLMDELIESEHDVALLTRMGVLTHGLGSDKDVADLFNGLFKGVTESPGEVFQKMRKYVNAHYKSKIKVHFARLVQDHFSSPWKALALAAAVVLLLLAAVQTIFSIISVYKSH